MLKITSAALTCVFVMVCVVFTSGSMVKAQTNSNYAKKPSPNFKTLWGKDPKDNPSNGTIATLKKAVPLGNLPEFTGHKKFIHGSVRNTDLGEGWTQYFECKEAPDVVLQWYKQVFQSQQWKISANNGVQISARDQDGARCQVATHAAAGDVKTSLMITYFVPKKNR